MDPDSGDTPAAVDTSETNDNDISESPTAGTGSAQEDVDSADREDIMTPAATNGEKGDGDSAASSTTSPLPSPKKRSLKKEKPAPPQREGNRRERKQTQRLSAVLDKVYQEQEEKKEVFTIPKGRGDKLGDCEYINAMLARTKTEKLKMLHSLCFNRKGKSITVRKNLRRFCGFEWEGGEDAPEHEKLISKIKTRTRKEISFMLSVLGLEVSGSRVDELALRLAKFLACPWDSGKSAPESGPRKRAGSKKRRSSSAKGRGSKKEKRASKKKEKQESDEDESADDESGDASSDDASSEEDSDEPKKRTPAKKVKKQTPKKSREPDDSSSDDDEPLVKKTKKGPTDEEIKSAVKKILKKADLEKLTMKKVLRKVGEVFPNIDISSKKSIIKDTVQTVIDS